MLYFLLFDRFSDGNEKDGYRDNDGPSGEPRAPRRSTGPMTPAGSITTRGSTPAAAGRAARSRG